MMLDDLKARFGDDIESGEAVGRELRLRLRAASLVACCRFLEDQGYRYPADITAVDTGAELRVVYRLVSLENDEHIVISVALPRAGGSLPSVAGIFGAANWAEREVYDLFGVRFIGHPDLRRILLTDDWQGYPLLKTTQAAK